MNSWTNAFSLDKQRINEEKFEFLIILLLFFKNVNMNISKNRKFLDDQINAETFDEYLKKYINLTDVQEKNTYSWIIITSSI